MTLTPTESSSKNVEARFGGTRSLDLPLLHVLRESGARIAISSKDEELKPGLRSPRLSQQLDRILLWAWPPAQGSILLTVIWLSVRHPHLGLSVSRMGVIYCFVGYRWHAQTGSGIHPSSGACFRRIIKHWQWDPESLCPSCGSCGSDRWYSCSNDHHSGLRMLRGSWQLVGSHSNLRRLRQRDPRLCPRMLSYGAVEGPVRNAQNNQESGVYAPDDGL